MMNGLSAVFDQIVSNSYLSVCADTTGLLSDSCGQQLAFDAFGDKALVERSESTDHLTTHTFNPLNDSDNCLNTYFCDQQLTQNWNQFNNQLINENNLHNESLINSNDLNQCLNSFDTNFITNIETNSNNIINTNINIKQNNKKANNKLSNTKKLSRKESNTSVRPPKPVSAYALFFRDAQSVIKSTNPSASFGEISKVVASNWEALDDLDKSLYKERADKEKKNYLKTLASSRAQQIAGLIAESTAKLGINSLTQSDPQMSENCDSVLSDNRYTNETNRQNDKTNSFDSNQQMSDNNGSHSTSNNTNSNQNFVNNSSQQLQQNIVSTSEQSTSAQPKQHCIREGCANDAIDSPEWDSEYCSSDCCVKHCSDVFQAWVQKQQFPQNN